MEIINACDCGSNLTAQAVYDGYGIYLCRVCPVCREKRLARYRSDIFERYTTDGEPIFGDE